jgi:glutathione peroxidase
MLRTVCRGNAATDCDALRIGNSTYNYPVFHKIYGIIPIMKLQIIALLASLLGMSASSAIAAPPAEDLFSIPVQGIDGQAVDLAHYRGKVLLIVNTASRCGYTPQYKALEQVAKTYRQQGLEVLGFPSNDFGGQEPGSNSEIKYFCSTKYNVDFPMFSKAPVSGATPQPVFAWLLKNSPSSDAVAWNFEKFLIGRDGKVHQRFKSDVKPDSAALTTALEKELKQ